MRSKFTLRPPQEADIENLVNFINDWEETHFGIRPVTAEDIQQTWASPNFDITQSGRIAETEDGKIAGNAVLWDNRDTPVNPWFEIRIHPDYEESEVGNLLLHWGEKTAERCFDRVPNNARVALVSGAFHDHRSAKTLFEDNGFMLTRHFWEMKIDLDKPVQSPIWPDGFNIVHYDTNEDVIANLENIVIAIDDSFQDHFGYVPRPLDQAIEQWTYRINNDKKRFDPKLWFLAMDKDEIAAVCLCMKQDFDMPEYGHVNILGVRKPYRRKGLGLALLLHAFQEYERRGKTAVTLGVDASSITNATELYKKAGMYVDRQFDDYEKELRPGVDIVRRE